MKRLILSILPILVIATHSFAQSLNLPKGKTFEITTLHTDKGTYKSNELYTYSFRSLGKNSDGNIVLESKIVRAVTHDSQTQEQQLNTDSIRKTGLNSTGPLFYLAILNKPFKVIVSPEGKLVNLEGVKETLNNSLTQWGIKPDIQQTILANAESFPQTVAGLFYQGDISKESAAPEAKTSNSDSPFTLTKRNSSTVTIQSSNVTDNTKVEKKYVIDVNSGLITTGLTTNESVIENSPLPLAEKKVNIKTATKQTLTSIQHHKTPDTAWINAAVKLSYWSDAYKKGQEYDSAKVYPLLNVKDPGLLNDPYFVVNRLDAVQGIRSDRSYELYDSLLMTVPNKLLKGNYSHLHNKLGTALSESGPASAYEVSKYAIETEAFNQWLQHSFSQAFRTTQTAENQEGERLKKSYQLLELFKANNSIKYQQQVTPLYLWAKALKNGDDFSGLIVSGKLLAAMNDEEMAKGNGSRYSLLIYKQLLDARKVDEAAKLLDTTIQKLERYVADTLNKNRFAEQNMLAGAYYFKYETAKSSGDINEATYLAKAAKYSPRDAKEKAHSSFYDRVFLKTKESYREEYIEKLLSAGNEQEALKMFAEHIHAMPENIGEMQKLFARKFPDKEFKTFFSENVISSWALAPSFLLKGVDGKEYKLADYKDKWLVMDFWGTWCGPCREEMPVVNKFAVNAAEGKYKGVSFLSVACRDTESKVKQYLEENKFTMTAAMSDGQIERTYKLRYYPSKVFVSPSGRMILIDSGKDWQTIIKTFSTL